VARLADAVRRRDHADYAAAHERLARLHHVRVELQRRDDTARRLTIAAPLSPPLLPLTRPPRSGKNDEPRPTPYRSGSRMTGPTVGAAVIAASAGR
jgi:hypothetical protein